LEAVLVFAPSSQRQVLHRTDEQSWGRRPSVREGREWRERGVLRPDMALYCFGSEAVLAVAVSRQCLEVCHTINWEHFESARPRGNAEEEYGEERTHSAAVPVFVARPRAYRASRLGPGPCAASLHLGSHDAGGLCLLVASLQSASASSPGCWALCPVDGRWRGELAVSRRLPTPALRELLKKSFWWGVGADGRHPPARGGSKPPGCSGNAGAAGLGPKG